jgi:hypothetical protein
MLLPDGDDSRPKADHSAVKVKSHHFFKAPGTLQSRTERSRGQG